MNALTRCLEAARAESLLPAGTAPVPQDSRPWPVVLLTALGAWLAAGPLLAVIDMLLGDLVRRGAGPYVIGPLLLAAAVIVLRARDVPLFVEQLAVPALLVGGGTLGFGLFRDLPDAGAASVLAAVALGVAAVLRAAWLRVLLGAAAAGLVALACLPPRWTTFEHGAHAALGAAWHVVLALWIAALVIQRSVQHHAARVSLAATIESASAGWLLATLAGLAWWSGMTFLVGASAGGGLAGEVVRELGRRPAASASWNLLQATSVLLAAAAAWRLAVAWPDMRRAWWAGVALGMVVLAGFMPALGAALFALAWCAVDHRWRLAAAAGVAAAWIIGSFYYALAWPLATKAAVLVIAAAWLGAMAWWSWPRPPVAVPAARPARHGAASVGIALSAVATLVTANVGIWQKQDLIAHGEAVFIELAPVDPRSLMQGDYMRLQFRVPAGVDQQLDGLLHGERPRLVAKRDARGVATLQHLDTGTSLATDELRIELTPKNGRWTVVTDAWFFPEGQAPRWARAKYGEFRVDARGRALLVGLRGPQLEAL